MEKKDQQQALYVGVARMARELSGRGGGLLFATPYRGYALMMAIGKARGVETSKIVKEQGEYKLHILGGYPRQREVYVYRVSPEGFVPTGIPELLSKEGAATPLGEVERIVINDWKHYFLGPDWLATHPAQ